MARPGRRFAAADRLRAAGRTGPASRPRRAGTCGAGNHAAPHHRERSYRRRWRRPALAQMAAERVILSAPAVWGRDTMEFWPRLALWAAVRFFPDMTLTGRGLGILPSDNVAMLKALARDPMVLKGARVDTVYGLVDLMDAALALAPRLTAPLLLMYGAHDEIRPREPVAAFASALPADP